MRRFVQRYLLAFCAVAALLVASQVPQGVLGTRREGNRYPLPGKPLPNVELSSLFAPPSPVRRVTDAFVEPLENAAQRLRPYARLIFPALWDEPAPALKQEPYSVRDNALRVVRDTL